MQSLTDDIVQPQPEPWQREAFFLGSCTFEVPKGWKLFSRDDGGVALSGFGAEPKELYFKLDHFDLEEAESQNALMSVFDPSGRLGAAGLEKLENGSYRLGYVRLLQAGYYLVRWQVGRFAEKGVFHLLTADLMLPNPNFEAADLKAFIGKFRSAIEDVHFIPQPNLQKRQQVTKRIVHVGDIIRFRLPLKWTQRHKKPWQEFAPQDKQAKPLRVFTRQFDAPLESLKDPNQWRKMGTHLIQTMLRELCSLQASTLKETVSIEMADDGQLLAKCQAAQGAGRMFFWVRAAKTACGKVLLAIFSFQKVDHLDASAQKQVIEELNHEIEGAVLEWKPPVPKGSGQNA